jgi:UDP-glucose 4-epimerase
MLTHLNTQPIPPKRVVVLGEKGFLASHLKEKLRAASITHKMIGSSEIDLSVAENAARLAETLTPDDTVVMLSTVTPDKGRTVKILMYNLRLAETVCRALESTRCGHFVYLSSDAVYDADKTPLDEDSSREPVDLYAVTHTAREMMLGLTLGSTKTPYCILRPTNIYGPGDTHNNYGPNRFVRTALKEGRIVLFGQGEERRSHLYVGDAIDLIFRTILRRSVGTLNLASSPTMSFRQVADVVSKHCKEPVSLDFQPRTIGPIHRPYKATQVFRFLSKMGRKISPVVHRPYDVTAIFRAFPDFTYTTLDRGIEAYFDAIRQSPAGSTEAG